MTVDTEQRRKDVATAIKNVVGDALQKVREQAAEEMSIDCYVMKADFIRNIMDYSPENIESKCQELLNKIHDAILEKARQGFYAVSVGPYDCDVTYNLFTNQPNDGRSKLKLYLLESLKKAGYTTSVRMNYDTVKPKILISW